MESERLIREFDLHLHSVGLSFHGIAIGGAALNLLGVVSRYTRDCDILDPEIPSPVLDAAKVFATKMRAKGETLRDDWLNNGPQSLKRQLPADWMQRLSPLFKGKALHLQTLGRPDLLKSKLFAFCDRGTDRTDCLALKPSKDELAEALPWVQLQDANPDWPAHVSATFESLAKELGHGL